MKKLNVWVLDIETAPLEVFVWGRKDQNISLEQIKRDWYILAFSAKRLGDPASKIIYKDTNGHAWGDDKALLKEVWKVLDNADILVTQNGERFDSRKLNARFILQGMPPPSSYKHLDTYKILRRVADFTSHSLEYLTAKLCTKYKKLSHKKFPGWKLWAACLKDNKDAWKEMRRYNIHDVLATEELYMKTRAWASPSSPAVNFGVDTAKECRTCGVAGSMIKNGFAYRQKTKVQRFQCTRCNSWQ